MLPPSPSPTPLHPPPITPPASPPPLASPPPTVTPLDRVAAAMSSVYSATDYPPEMCIDGITENQGAELNFCLSELDQPDAWLSVTLPQRSIVSEVVVYGRSDCCNVRFLSGFEVWLSDAVGVPGADAYK